MRKCKDGTILQSGMKINMLTLISYHKGGMWDCQCDCGKLLKLRTGTITSGNNKSCGCFKKEYLRAEEPKRLRIVSRIKDPPWKIIARNIYNELYKDGDIALDQFIELSKQNCYYCGVTPFVIRRGNLSQYSPYTEQDIDFLYNGLDRINSDLPHILENCVVCCKHCNSAKKKLTPEKFLEKVNAVQRKEFMPYEIKSLELPRGVIRQTINIRFIGSYKEDSDLTLNEFYYLTQLNCFYCDAFPASCKAVDYRYSDRETLFSYNGLDRIDNNLGHIKSNVVPACKWCNYAKRSMTLEDFFDWIQRIKDFNKK